MHWVILQSEPISCIWLYYSPSINHFVFLSLKKINFSRATYPYALQIISAITGGITDLSFDAVGYGWQISNCILTASYSVCRLSLSLSPCPTRPATSFFAYKFVLPKCLNFTWTAFNIRPWNNGSPYNFSLWCSICNFVPCISSPCDMSWIKPNCWRNLDLLMNVQWCCWIICYHYLLLSSWFSCSMNGNT